jgi:hypothetical protein
MGRAVSVLLWVFAIPIAIVAGFLAFGSFR